VVKLLLSLLARRKPGVAVPLVNWPTMLPLSLMPKALMAPPGTVSGDKMPSWGKTNAVVPFPPTTVPALLMPKATWPVPVFSGTRFAGVPEVLAKTGASFTSTALTTVCPALLMPFAFEPTAAPAEAGSKLVNTYPPAVMVSITAARPEHGTKTVEIRATRPRGKAIRPMPANLVVRPSLALPVGSIVRPRLLAGVQGAGVRRSGLGAALSSIASSPTRQLPAQREQAGKVDALAVPWTPARARRWAGASA